MTITNLYSYITIEVMPWVVFSYYYYYYYYYCYYYDYNYYDDDNDDDDDDYYYYYYHYCCCYLMANLQRVPSTSNSKFRIIRGSMHEQRRMFRRQNSTIYSPFRSGFLKPQLNWPSVNRNSFPLWLCWD